MSIEIGKRLRIEQDHDDFKYKRTFKSDPEPCSQVIDFGSQSLNENLIRLYSLFPRKGREELLSALEATCNNLDSSITLLQKKDRDKALDECTYAYATNLVQNLRQVYSMEDASRMVQAYMKKHTSQISEVSSSAMYNENKELERQIGILNNDTSMLKKAVLKLHSRLLAKKGIEDEYEALCEQLKQEKYKNYALRSQVSQNVNNFFN
ncbi:unnamed protein product [Blepharisma stoltei]|uniref:Uncharacterized protein n=1 Tax=Blepharisma stoltei TaxID=1481888 RepID=A0AAU9KAA1_9CILI|nr:unnamed protein product [Blepharisma stoltei]